MAHKTKREKVWYALYCIFAKHLPSSDNFPLGKAFRVFFAKRIISKVGIKTNIEKGARFCGECYLGDYSGIGINCELNGPVRIGKYVNMGPEVVFYTQNHTYSRTDIPMQRQGFELEKPIIVGDDVWIGRRVIILPGVKIGDGVIIGAGAVVTKDVEPYSVAAGNPAKVVKRRKTESE